MLGVRPPTGSEVEPVDLLGLVLGLEDLLGQSLGPLFTRASKWRRVCPPSSPTRRSSKSALVNVIINARDAMPLGGAITVTAAERLPGGAADLAAGDYVRISVARLGEGMSEETLARATEPFFTTKDVGKGTGLGLAMIHGLMMQSGGALRLGSRIGVGTDVELWLPVAEGEAAENPVGGPITAVAALKSLKILVVDDDELVLLNTVAMLEDLGHTVTQANNAEEALAVLAADDDIDLLITDHAMPRISGVQLALRAASERPHLPIILATGYAELPSGEGEGLAQLDKPFDQAQLAR